MVQQIKTRSASFTTFSAEILLSDQGTNHILIANSCPDFPHKPKMLVLSENCEQVIQTTYLDSLSTAQAHNATKSKFTGKPKKGA